MNTNNNQLIWIALLSGALHVCTNISYDWMIY